MNTDKIRTNKNKQQRLNLVADLYKKGYNPRQIREQVVARLDLKSCSLRTIYADIQQLLKEWREHRLNNIADAIQLELERIDNTVSELWQEWEKSRTDVRKTTTKRKAAPASKKEAAEQPSSAADMLVETKDEEVIRLGNVSYITEIRAQLAERRRILGIYAPEKRDITGEIQANISIVPLHTDKPLFASSEDEAHQ